MRSKKYEDSRGPTLDADQDQKLADLLVLGQQGNREAYERFLQEASKVLRAYLSKRMGAIDLVEDVLQDTLLSIHRSRHTFRSEKPVGPWLYAICQHRMIDFFRRYRRIEKAQALEEDQLVHMTSVSAQAENNEAEEVFAFLKRLPDKQREVIELLKIHDLSVKEVAAQTGMSESAVKVTAFRGYETIRRFLGVSK